MRPRLLTSARTALASALAVLALAGCQSVRPVTQVPVTVQSIAVTPTLPTAVQPVDTLDLSRRLGQYTTFRLTTDLGVLSVRERQMLGLLIDAADEMNAVFWLQSYGPSAPFLGGLPGDAAQRYAAINYGPWDRLDGNAPWLPGVGPKPPGAQFYPPDMTTEAFDAYVAAHPDQADALRGLYTLVRRTPDGRLLAVPYHEAYREAHERAAALLRQAAALADDAGLRTYLTLRADALLTDDYQPSDLAWMDMKTNRLDIVIGPIETYEDELFGYKAAHEAYVLVKDLAWSERLGRFAALLPDLQRGLPVDAAYKQESPGTDSDLGAYDVVYVAGHANAGSKTIAINLPNDEAVQLQKGSRRLQLKNAMQAKFDAILVPMADVLIAPDQRRHITFDAFFANTMFHEVAHGLGIKNTITGSGTVREALRDHASALEEGKADVLGLYMVQHLHDRGELAGDLTDNYVTFVASIFRSIRFGTASAHAKANLVRYNFFREFGAIERTPGPDGVYRVVPDRIQAATDALSARILQLQGAGNYAAVQAFVDQYQVMPAELEADLARVSAAGIPVDVVFEQGHNALGL